MSTSTSFATDFDGDKTINKYDFAKKKYGQNGRKISIYSNYFGIEIDPSNSSLYRYCVEINLHDFIRNNSDSKVPQRSKLNQQKKINKEYAFLVFDKLFKSEPSLFSSEPVFDGRNIYSKTKLLIPEKKIEFKVKIENKDKKKKFPLVFDVIISIPDIESHELNLSILNQPNVRNADKEIQASDAILKYGPKHNKLLLGSNLFLRKPDVLSLPADQRKKNRIYLGDLKEIGFGHYQSTKLTEVGAQLNVDRVAIVFNKGGKLIDIIEQLCTNIRSPKRFNSTPQRQIEIKDDFKLSSIEQKIINNELKNLEFYVDHISYRPKNKITCLTKEPVKDIKFNQKLKNGEIVEISVKEYFEETYKDYIDRLGRKLFSNLPCIKVGNINPKYFPIEVVNIIEDQYSTKKLQNKNQTIMTKICSEQKPTERFSEYETHIKDLVNSSREGDRLTKFGINLNVKYSECNGRILNSGKLLLKNDKNIIVKDGEWIKDGKFVIPASQIGCNWMVINFTKEFSNELKSAPNKNQIDKFIEMIIKCAKDNDINLGWPKKVVYDETYKGHQDLDDATHDYLKDNGNLKFIIYFIPKLEELYESIKYLTEIVYGIPTQCVSQDKSRSQFTQMSYISNLMLKINVKLGGSNIHLAQDCRVAYLKKKTMIMGLDSTRSENKSLPYSISSVVSTFDKHMVNYLSKSIIQPKNNHEIIQLDDITAEMIENFKKKTNILPDFILVYRNGIGDCQFNDVIQKEIILMKKAFKKISPNYSPKITFIVVQKRHHTRFLSVNKNDRALRSQNVLPGTCIDNTITSNFYFDFFLCAHSGALGTSRPTRYIVLHDDTDFSGDDIQQTTNLLSHLFPRCMKITSAPAPVLFAHLVSKRAKMYLNASGCKSFNDKITQSEIQELNKKIQVKENLRNVLYYV